MPATIQNTNPQVATGSFDKTAKIWDANTGQLYHTFRGHQTEIVCLAFNPASTVLATGSMDNTAKARSTREFGGIRCGCVLSRLVSLPSSPWLARDSGRAALRAPSLRLQLLRRRCRSH